MNFPLLAVKRDDSFFERAPIVNLNRLLMHFDFLTYPWLMYIQFRAIITLPIYMKYEGFRAFESKIESAFVGSVQLYRGDLRALVKAPIGYYEKKAD